jgi:hypothetical protein
LKTTRKAETTFTEQSKRATKGRDEKEKRTSQGKNG